jgi:hypothetical protein
MSPRRRLPDELGKLVAVERPRHPVGWIVLGVLPVPFALFAAFGPPGPLVGLATLLGLALPLAYGFAEWFFLQHRIYEHGIVFRTDLPGTYKCVVPFATVDPDQIEVAPRRRTPRGEFEIAPRHERHHPLLEETLRFPGLTPYLAHDLAKRKLTWEEAASFRPTPDTVRWQISVRAPEAKRHLLADTVRRSRATDSGPRP